MKKLILPIILLITAVWLLYGQTGGFEFLRLDDHDYTFRCLFVRDGLSWSNVVEALTNARHAAIWMPVTYITYMADISLFGPGMGPHHLVNVAVHALNAALLFLLLLALSRKCSGGAIAGGDAGGAIACDDAGGAIAGGNADAAGVSRGAIWFAACAAAFWVLHPQRVEAVAWIAGRKELLCAFFILLGLLCRVRGGKVRTIGSIVCCALACMSKPTGMCFPFLALAVDLPVTGRTGCVPTRSTIPNTQHPITSHQSSNNLINKLTNKLINYIPLFAMAIATGALAMYSQTHPEGLGDRALFNGSFAWRVLNAAVATGLYLYHMIVPTGIHLDYAAVPGRFPIDGVTGLVTLAAVLAGIGLIAWRVRTSRRIIASCALFFFASLVPTLGIFGSFGEHARADRFFYLPSMAVVGLIGLLVNWLIGFRAGGGLPGRQRPANSCGALHTDTSVRENREASISHLRFPPTRKDANVSQNPGAQALPTQSPTPNKPINQLTSLIVSSIVVTIYAITSWPVIASYKNDYTAFSRTLKFEPDNGRALAHVAGEECSRFGHIDKGIELLRRSQAVRPRDDTAAQLAYTLALRGFSTDHGEIRRLCAKFACDHSLDRKGMALEALGVTAMRQRKWKEAIACFESSIKAPYRFYSDADARLRLGACYANARRPDDAIRIFEPLTQSPRTDIAPRAAQFLQMLKANPSAVILF